VTGVARRQQLRVRPAAPPDPSQIRVLWMTTSFFPSIGGLEIFIEKTLESLSGMCEVGLVTKHHHWIPGNTNIAHFRLYPPRALSGTGSWTEVARQLEKIIARFSPDLVHFGSARSAIFRWAVPPGLPVLATVHGNDLTDARPRPGGDDPTPLIVESLNACDRILPVSRHTGRLCRQWGVKAPRSVLSPGCDLNFFREWPALGEEARAFYGIPPDMPAILTVSRLAPRKGHMNVLNALEEIPFETQWIVVGDGPCRNDLERAAEERGLSSRISFMGKISDDDLLGLYNACDVFVLTPEEQHTERWLDSEGFGLVLHEAGACGKPVIASNTSGCSEAVVDGKTGILVPPGDHFALANALYFLFTHPQDAIALGAGGMKHVQRRGGWPGLARQLLSTYQAMYLDPAKPVRRAG
jgi:phosphatidyl-myo-inositol dimannoside synthase